MNKKMFLSALAALIVVCSTGVSYAQDVLFEDKAQSVMQEKRRHFAPPSKHKFKHQGPSKAEIEAKKLEFEKRLNLTEEQKLQIEKNKQKDKEKIKPLFENQPCYILISDQHHQYHQQNDADKVNVSFVFAFDRLASHKLDQ